MKSQTEPRSHSESYRAAGVDITAGYRAVTLMQEHIARTRIPGVLGGVGAFSGLFDLGDGRVLAAGCDGVGTKIKLAFLLDQHDTVGIDCVAMSVNDLICCGARPLFFLDYIAAGKTIPERAAALVAGIAEGCVQAGCTLLGGETAEMPDLYAPDEYDLAGFAVGICEKARLLDPKNTAPGDALIALPSSGPHSNGFSLIRKVFPPERLQRDPALAQALLTPTRVYVQPFLALLDALPGAVHAAANITGGGFQENIPRALGPGCSAQIDRAALRTPPIFEQIAREGNIPERDMFNTFNMGVGMVVAVAGNHAGRACAVLSENGVDAYVLGRLVAGDGEVLL
jgi:phosphoribosylformylglycinamidine cyclo-ligase